MSLMMPMRQNVDQGRVVIDFDSIWKATVAGRQLGEWLNGAPEEAALASALPGLANATSIVALIGLLACGVVLVVYRGRVDGQYRYAGTAPSGGHTPLGLTVVRHLAGQHGLLVRFRARAAGGLQAEVSLPRGLALPPPEPTTVTRRARSGVASRHP